MTWQILDSNYEQAKIAVIGIGGGGGNTIQHMISSGIKGVEFICANTDSQALSMIHNAKTIKLGNDLTKGLGAGNNPEVGKQATELSRQEIIDLTHELIESVVSSNWETYTRLCADDLTAFEPEGVGNVIEGMAFHKF